MNAKRQVSALRVSALAVQGALIALALTRGALAEDDASVKQLTAPTSSIEAGVQGVSKDSFKFGEYNGLQGKGVYGIGNLDLRGGGGYDSNDATRWRIRGSDLGLQTRDLQAEWGEQGKFRITFGFDELLRNRSDTYMTPYLGAGGTTLKLPSNWNAPLFQTSASLGAGNTYPAPVATMLGLGATGANSPLVTNANFLCRQVIIPPVLTPGLASPAGSCAANPAFLGAFTTGYVNTVANQAMLAQNLTDLNDFKQVNLSTMREKYDVGMGVAFNRNWDASFSVRREDKTGLKGLGVVNAGNGGYAGENAVVLPELINHTTDQFNAALNFKGEKSFVTLAYYGSFFTNHAKAMTLDNPYGVGTYNNVTQTAFGVSSATITEEPDSIYQQVKVTGGYKFGATTRLVADIAASRNQQNDPFILDPGVFGTPSSPTGATTAFFSAPNNGTYLGANSANAVVSTHNVDLKLTTKPLRDVNLSAAYKFDDRDNRTPVNTYVWYDAGAKNVGSTALAPNALLNSATLGNAVIPGLPNTTTLYSGANIVDNRPYSKRVNQLNLDADYAFAAGQSVRVGFDWQKTDRYCSGSWIDCSFADSAFETTERGEYKFHLGDSLGGRLSADHSNRHVNYNDNAWMALVPTLAATDVPGLIAATTGPGLTPYHGSVLDFLRANGLSTTGLPLNTNQPSPFVSNPTNLAIYQQLFGTGNGSLSSSYYGNRNTTNNWPGLDIYSMANRDRNRVRGSIDWQPTDALSLQFGGDYRHENYPDSTYGLKTTHAWALNVDGDYAVADNFAVSGYYSYEDQSSTAAGNPAGSGTLAAIANGAAYGVAYTAGPTIVPGGTVRNNAVVGLCGADSIANLNTIVNSAGAPAAPTQFQIQNANAKIDPCLRWQAEMKDKTNTVGISLTKKRLFSPKLSLRGDATYSRSTTSNTMSGGSYAASPVAAFINGVPASYFVNAASLPDVTTDTLQFRLTGGYQLGKTSLLRISYTFARLHTDDWVYGTNTAAGTSGNVMPTFESAPNYAVQAVGVSYVYSFQ